jgi:hypothetical protein
VTDQPEQDTCGAIGSLNGPLPGSTGRCYRRPHHDPHHRDRSGREWDDAPACGEECAEGHAYAGRCTLYDPTACTWPDCLTDGQQAELAEQVRAAGLGESTAPMPDQRQACGCRDKPTATCPAATWAGLTICVTCPTPEPGTACAREPDALLRAATARTTPDTKPCARCTADERTRGIIQPSAMELYPPDHEPGCAIGLRDEYARAIRAELVSLRRDVPASLDVANAVLAVRDTELQQARETNRRLNLRCQEAESALATIKRSVGEWEISERGTYVPLRTIAAIGKAVGRDITNARWLLHYQRVETAEAAITRIRQLADRWENALAPDRRYAEALRAALDGPADTTPPATLPGRSTVTIDIQAPDQANADRWAGTIRDFIEAEHGEQMRLDIRITPEAGR